MRVSDRMMMGNYVRNLMKKESSLSKLNNQISSGTRISVPSDDPIGAVRSMSLNSNLNEIKQYTANSEYATTWLNTADDAFSTADKYLQRVYELVVSGSSSDKPMNSLMDMADEVDQIRDGLVQVANTTVGNNYIFAGQQTNNPAYANRTPATGDARDLAMHPIQITAANNSFQIKLDSDISRTVTLTQKTYDGSPGNTLNDLAADIQKQLDGTGFSVPVYAKATPDNRIVFYAGKKPSDGVMHTLVFKDTPGDTTLSQLGFFNKANTKELVGSVLNEPILVTGRYPELGATQGSTGNSLTLESASSAVDDYYKGWTLAITSGTGAGQSQTITGYHGASKIADVAAWGTQPDSTSQYSLTPPRQGTVAGNLTGTAQAGSATGMTLAVANGASDNYYTGWTISITGGTGAGQSQAITGYDGTTNAATVGTAWGTTPDATSQYFLIPPTVGGDKIILAANASSVQDFYKGMPLTINSGKGVGQTRTITAYDPVTKTATLDKAWDVAPDGTSNYTIDTNYYVATDSKFKITVGLNPPQEISLDGGNYTVKDLATQIQTQIQARGGAYANVFVSATPEKQLRFSYIDPTMADNDNPLPIKLESGSTGDILTKIGFNNGVRSETPIPNYEGDQGISEYEINQGTHLGVNMIGDQIFDSLFQHLTKISQNLRTGNSKALSSTDLKNLKDDMQKVILAQGECGAKVNRLEKGLDWMANVSDSINKLISDVEDTDVTQAAMEYKAQSNAYEAALMIGANILPKTLMDYLK